MPELSLRVATLLLLIPLTLSHAGKSAPASYTLAVQVAYGSNKGAESFREELELRLVRELQLEGCFEEIRAGAPDAEGVDLLLVALIQDMEQRTDYNLTIAQRDSPNSTPTESRRMMAWMEATIELQLLLLPEKNIVRERRLRSVEGYRPQLDEDPQYEVQLLTIESLARSARRFVCKDSRKKLRKEIERARGAP